MNVLSTFLLFLHKLITLKYLQVHFTTGILFELVGKRKTPYRKTRAYCQSERRGSNSRHPPWQGGYLSS